VYWQRRAVSIPHCAGSLIARRNVVNRHLTRRVQAYKPGNKAGVRDATVTGLVFLFVVVSLEALIVVNSPSLIPPSSLLVLTSHGPNLRTALLLWRQVSPFMPTVMHV